MVLSMANCIIDQVEAVAQEHDHAYSFCYHSREHIWESSTDKGGHTMHKAHDCRSNAE